MTNQPPKKSGGANYVPTAHLLAYDPHLCLFYCSKPCSSFHCAVSHEHPVRLSEAGSRHRTSMWSRKDIFPSNPVVTVLHSFAKALSWVYKIQAIRPSCVVRHIPSLLATPCGWLLVLVGTLISTDLQIGDESEGSPSDNYVRQGLGCIMLLEHVWRKRKWIRRFNRICGYETRKDQFNPSSTCSCRLLDRSTIATLHGRTSAGPPKVLPIHWFVASDTHLRLFILNIPSGALPTEL